jgi:hypothetical protein
MMESRLTAKVILFSLVLPQIRLRKSETSSIIHDEME